MPIEPLMVRIHIIYDLLQNTIAAITPGIQPHKVNTETSSIAPQPLSRTASGGNIIAIIALKHPTIYTIKILL